MFCIYCFAFIIVYYLSTCITTCLCVLSIYFNFGAWSDLQLNKTTASRIKFTRNWQQSGVSKIISGFIPWAYTVGLHKSNSEATVCTIYFREFLNPISITSKFNVGPILAVSQKIASKQVKITKRHLPTELVVRQ